MVAIKFLGGCLRVGGSAVSVETPAANLLLDYGAYMGDHPSFPSAIAPKDLDAILLTHAHLDHSGGIPLLFSGSATPRLFATPITLDITRTLIEDMIRISEYYLPFGKNELMRMISKAKHVSYEDKKINSHCVAHFLDAGHIPGSCSIYLELDGRRILYTGDFNSNTTQLLNSAQLNVSQVDCLIIESTYASEDHPPREETERKLVERINDLVEKGGTVLIPAFGVARSQEILCVLYKHKFQYSIIIDGMARAVNRIFSANHDYLRDPKLFEKALKRAQIISQGKRKEEERSRAIETPGVIIAPSGMLKGGMAINYMNDLFQDPKNGIFLVSFQIPDTPGRQLLDTKKWNDLEVNAQVEAFNFSSHAGRSGLWALIHAIEQQNSEIPVFCMHGEEQNCVAFAKEISETTKLNAIAPKVDESFEI
jgi:putative mRNA 3-end processing factor